MGRPLCLGVFVVSSRFAGVLAKSAAVAPSLVTKKTSAENSCTLAIKVIPNAPRTEIIGWLGDALKIKVHAPPVEGKANDALCDFLAEHLNLPRRAVTVLRGDTSRQKLIRLDGLTQGDLREKLAGCEKQR